MPAKRLFIIDAMAMAFRNFHAFGVRPISNSRGLPTSAIFGSAQFLIKLLTEEKPDYIAIATDSPEPTFRHQLYGAYKANRTEMPEDLARQIPHLFRLFQALGCTLLKQPGVEADDLIGSLVRRYRGPDLQCFIVSGDKDFMQLIDPNTFLYIPLKGGLHKVINHEGVQEKFACTPSQVVDVLAIMGDSSDNVPGVRGIGEKGASKLIAEFGSLAGVYEGLDRIKNQKILNALTEHRDLAYLSQKLVTIECGVAPLPELENLTCDLRRSLANQELLYFVQEMEFRRLTEQVAEWCGDQSHFAPAQDAAADPVEGPTIAPQPSDQDYRLVVSKNDFTELLQELDKVDTFAFDTETTGLDIVSDRPIGISLAVGRGRAYYLPLVAQHGQQMMQADILTGLQPYFMGNKTKVAHNLKFDLQMLNNIGLKVGGPLYDTMLCSYLLNANSRSHGLDACSLSFLKYAKIPTSQLIGKRAEISMLDVPIDLLTRYACEDADFTLRLLDFFLPLIEKNGLTQVLNEVEMPLVPILAEMEQQGVFIDAEALASLSRNLESLAGNCERQIYEHAGETFNINSTKQLQNILFEKLKIHQQLNITRLKKTKSGFSTDVSVLERMSEHALPRTLLEYRTVTKLKNTYVDALPKLIHNQSLRVHARFHQTGTATGRLSSSDPNLQNVPIRTELGREIRRAFRARSEDYCILSADYSQIELRILAHLAEDENLIEAFKRGEDIHKATASKIFDVPMEAVDREMRDQAKAINFGIVYGMGPNRLARQTGVNYAKAEEFIEKYFAGYPSIRTFIQQTIEKAHAESHTRTITGRMRPFNTNDSEEMGGANLDNIAINTPIQGSAADLIKIAMIQLRQEFAKRGLSAQMLLQVHDELVFECLKEELAETQACIKEVMSAAMQLRVPLEVNIGSGPSWLEAH